MRVVISIFLAIASLFVPLLWAQLVPDDKASESMDEKAAVELTGNATYDLIDDDANGLAEALAADVEVRLHAAGEYTFVAHLSKNGRQIAYRPAWESALTVRATLDAISGSHTVRLRFSGEEIFRSEEDGPYDLEVLAVASNGSTSTRLVTPSLDHSLFGEVGARLTGVAESPVDADGDGAIDYLQVTLDLDVRLDADFRLQGALHKNGQTLADSGVAVRLEAGAQQVSLDFDVGGLRISGVDGPYDGSVNLIDAEGHTLDGVTFTTGPYTAESFSAPGDMSVH